MLESMQYWNLILDTYELQSTEIFRTALVVEREVRVQRCSREIEVMQSSSISTATIPIRLKFVM